MAFPQRADEQIQVIIFGISGLRSQEVKSKDISFLEVFCHFGSARLLAPATTAVTAVTAPSENVNVRLCDMKDSVFFVTQAVPINISLERKTRA